MAVIETGRKYDSLSCDGRKAFTVQDADGEERPRGRWSSQSIHAYRMTLSLSDEESVVFEIRQTGGWSGIIGLINRDETSGMKSLIR